MNTEDYLERITNYIKDTRFSRAILIDGEWGCGKTFFVKTNLIPRLKGEHKVHKDLCYMPLLVSLYGLSSIEDIQIQICSALLEQIIDIEEKKGNHKNIKAIYKYTSLFGTAFIKGVGKHVGLDELFKEFNSQASESIFSSYKDEIVLIFDDVERCQVDIIELMGFLNNLCENNNYRVVVIANEKEIAKKENVISLAIQKQTALLDLYGKGIIKSSIKPEKNIGNSNKDIPILDTLYLRNSLDDSDFRDILDDHVEKLYEKDTLYERTREKLIGFSVCIENDINECYEDISQKYVDEKAIPYLLKYQHVITSTFFELNHRNLRTLISVFIATESIINCINEENLQETSIIEDELYSIIKYISYTAIEKTNGKRSIVWNNKRFDMIHGANISKGSILGYAFVDEYWNSLVANKERINQDLSTIIEETKKLQCSITIDNSHESLTLFSLTNKTFPWYTYEDKIVIEKLETIKEELKNKYYYPQDFRYIICLLMDINNPNYGINQSLNPSDYYINNFQQWDKINISDYVDLMLLYFDDENYEISKESLLILFSDPELEEQYNAYIQPLVDKINEMKFNTLFVSESNTNIIKDVLKKLSDDYETYKNKNAFISIYGFITFHELIRKSSPSEINQLILLIDKVYSHITISNAKEFELNDLNEIRNSLRKDRRSGRQIYNSTKSRTKEIALVSLENKISAQIIKIK